MSGIEYTRDEAVAQALIKWRATLAERVQREAEYHESFKLCEESKQLMIEARGYADIARYDLEQALMKEFSNDPS